MTCAMPPVIIRRRRASSGFTLIELLLATGMVAMLLLSLYVGMYTAFHARVSVSAQTDVMRQAKVALDLVEQDLRSILPPAGVLAGPFVGTPGGTGDSAAASIDCYSLGQDFIVTADATNTDGMRHVMLMTTADTTGNALIRRISRNPLDSAAAVPEDEVLAREVVGFDAQYFDGATWTDTWDSTQQSNALPLAVDLTILIKAPRPGDKDHVYRLSRIVTLPCGQTPDQAAAIAAAADAAATGTTDTAASGTGATGTGTTGGGQ